MARGGEEDLVGEEEVADGEEVEVVAGEHRHRRRRCLRSESEIGGGMGFATFWSWSERWWAGSAVKAL